MKRASHWKGGAFAIALSVLAASWAQATEPDAVLIMVEQSPCEWCEAWDEEISAIYPKTWEGRAAPLRRVDLHDPPADLAHLNLGRYTPTFILLVDGKERGRIRGYPGEDFFWGLLDEVLGEAGLTKATAPTQPNG